MTGRAHHLTDAEFVDLLDGTLDAHRRQHVDSCGQCAAQAAELAAGADAVDTDGVPEPPPFFWTQFSARVSERVAAEATTPPIAAFAWLRPPWMGATAVICLVILVAFFVPRSPAPTAMTPLDKAGVDGTTPADPAFADDISDLDSDEAWALVRSLAADLDEDQMDDEGVSLGAGAAERLTLQLSDAERTELARLLEEQLRQSGARESAS